MFLDEQLPDEKFIDGNPTPVAIAKKPWISPQLMLISNLDIANTVGTSGDGDAALAQS